MRRLILSVHWSSSDDATVQAGKALQPLRDEGTHGYSIAIVGDAAGDWYEKFRDRVNSGDKVDISGERP